MKKVLLVAFFLIFCGLNNLVAQRHRHIKPIPSYNCQLSALNTAFQEAKTHVLPSREKREMDVVISSSSSSPMLVFATVYVVKDNGSVVKGPFTVFPDEILSVQIDHGLWGVIINCDWEIEASVWID